ncbi:MAG TPA: hypothetical protein VHX38_18675 [Pseudonocardiaceae bacterium]|jgi:hypothetical protein|nr:hypothetical protein [Pseudonocardiaceae bacterium]
MIEITNDLLRDVLATLKSIDGKLPDPPKPPERAPSRIKRAGRVFVNGQIIPVDVDLVIGAAGMRWKRILIDGEPSDLWTPRDVGGLELSSNDLLARCGHVTEVPDPTAEEG